MSPQGADPAGSFTSGGALGPGKRLPLIAGVLVLGWILVLVTRTSHYVRPSASSMRGPTTSIGDGSHSATEPAFTSYDQAVEYVRGHYAGESIDTRRSSWITSAEYFPADGRGYLILGMQGRPYIFEGVPAHVWEEFKGAPSLGRYYNEKIRGRYRLNLE